MIDINEEKFLRQCIESFYFAYREFTTQPDQILSDQGLNRVHHRILYFVGRDPGLAVNDLLDVLQISKQALHAPLKQLQAMGLITSSPGEHDRRVRQLDLSRSGRILERQLSSVQMLSLRKAMEECGPQVADNWLLLMKALS